MIKTIINIGVSLVAIGCFSVFFLFAPTPPTLAAIDAPGQPLVLDDDTQLTAFFERERGALRLTVIFEDPSEAEEDSLLRTSIRMADQQSFSLIVGDQDEGTGRRFTFNREGAVVKVKAEDYPEFDFLQQFRQGAEPRIEVAHSNDRAG